MKKAITYEARGTCWGVSWDNCKGGYPTIHYENDSLEGLQQEILRDIKSGGIDSGFGFQSIYGAVMLIKTITTVYVGDKPFINEEEEIKFFGDLNDEELKKLLYS